MRFDPMGENDLGIAGFFLLIEEKIIFKKLSKTALGKGDLTNEDAIDIFAKQTLSTVSKIGGIKNSEMGIYINMAYTIGKDLGSTGSVSPETVVKIAKDIIAEGGVVFLASVTGGGWYTNPYAKTAVKELLKFGGDFGEIYLTKAQDDFLFPFFDKTLGPLLFPNKSNEIYEYWKANSSAYGAGSVVK
jgi:hypothetical protein